MSKNPVFRSTAEAIRDSGFVVPIFFIFGILLAIGLLFSVVDYLTTLEGIQMLPTRRVWPGIDYAVALLPWLLISACGYILTALDASTDRRIKNASKGKIDFRLLRNVVLAIWLVSISVDVITDTYYKASSNFYDPYIWLVALGESIFIYTLGSDMLALVGFGMVWELLPDVISIIRAMPLRMNQRWMQQVEKFAPKQEKKRPNPPTREPRRERPPVIPGGN